MEPFNNLEAVVRAVLYKKVFLKLLQNSQENTCVGVSFLTELQARESEVFSCIFNCIEKSNALLKGQLLSVWLVIGVCLSQM